MVDLIARTMEDKKQDGLDKKEFTMSLFRDMMEPIVCQVAVEALAYEKQMGRPCSKCNDKRDHRICTRPGYDIFGQPKQVDTPYVDCPNCSRSIAGSRFAAHLERCLDGRNKRGRPARSKVSSYASSGITSPYGSTASSPARSAQSVSDDEQRAGSNGQTQPQRKVRKVGRRPAMGDGASGSGTPNASKVSDSQRTLSPNVSGISGSPPRKTK